MLQRTTLGWFPGRAGSAEARWPAGVAGQASPYRAKRVIDIAGAVVGLLLGAPLLLLIAVAVKLDSAGPALFRQRRVGLGGRPFEMLKFRSMSHGGEIPEVWAAVNDRRVTRLGRLLRRSRLDEAPQLWNVLRGEMSLIGPRPEQVGIAARLASISPRFEGRHRVLPGISGWAQVHNGYADSESESLRKLDYDLEYVDRASIALDWRIFWRTLWVVFTGKGSR